MYKSQAAVGTERVVGCTLKTCTKKGEKAWCVNSFAEDHCCSYQRTGYQVEENIGSQIAEDGVITSLYHVLGGRGGLG